MSGGIQDVLKGVAASAERGVTSAPSIDAYVPWDQPSVEEKVPGEEAKTAEIQVIMERLRKRNFDKHRHAFRATHLKTQPL